MTLRLARLWLIPCLFAAAPGLVGQVPPAPPAKSTFTTTVSKTNPDMVDSFKVSDVDIDAILNALEFFTGKSVVRPGQLQTSTYTLRITRPIPKAELVTALETLLALNNISVSPMGERFLKVVPLAQAKSEAPEMVTGSSLDLPPSGKIVTKLFELNFLRVSEFVPQIQPFMTPGIGGGIVQLEKSNVMLITDSLENIQRIERPAPGGRQAPREQPNPRFYTLHNAKASDIVQKIHAMLAGPAQNQLRATTTFTPDDRSGQIVVIADPREYPLFDSLIEKLDVNADPGTRNEVIYLKHADAKDVSTLLSQLITGQNSAAQKAGAAQVPVRPAMAGQPIPLPATPAVAAAPDSVFGGLTEFSNYVTVQPDERTNSVVVSGTADDIRLIKEVVDKIDILLAQVRIEVVIAEVTFSNTSNTGISSIQAAIGPAPNKGTSITNITASIAGLGIMPAAGVTNSVNPINILASLSSLGDISHSKILQQSTIVTTHNKEAMITVTDQLPVITSSVTEPLAAGAATTSSFAQSSSVSYKDIGITLKVTPLIGDDGSVQLKIDQTVDNQGPSVVINGTSQPSILHREANSFVNTQSDELVVLGGFQSSTKSLDRQKLGILFEIPILSNLLGFRSNETERSELLLFLRPHVLQASEGTVDTHRAINGMSNKDQVNKFLTNPSHVPDAKLSVKEKAE